MLRVRMLFMYLVSYVINVAYMLTTWSWLVVSFDTIFRQTFSRVRWTYSYNPMIANLLTISELFC